MDEMGPILDALDESEWEEHNEVKKLRDKWKEMRQELDNQKKELKKLKENREEEIRKALEEKQREVDEAEKRLRELEKELQEALEELNQWQTNALGRLQGPADEIARRLAYLRAVQKSILRERDDLRDLLGWETKLATQKTVEEMERIIAEDIDHVLQWMNPAWFRLVLENRKLVEELESLNAENQLLELEVDTLQRQCGKMENEKIHSERIKTWKIRPLTLPGLVDRYLRTRDKIQLYDYPVTNLIHE
jgi:chromosome segregation ATPase